MEACIFLLPPSWAPLTSIPTGDKHINSLKIKDRLFFEPNVYRPFRKRALSPLIFFKVGWKPSYREILLFSGKNNQVWLKLGEIQKVIFQPFMDSFQRVLSCESHVATLLLGEGLKFKCISAPSRTNPNKSILTNPGYGPQKLCFWCLGAQKERWFP